jgi:tRNA(fMet)-specific endonuclease VapC
MLILDTDHFSEYLGGSSAGARLRDRLTGLSAATTIITIEEQSRGWLARIKRARVLDAKVAVYSRYHHMISTAGRWTILPWDRASAEVFEHISAVRPRVGTADLMIASIALANKAPLLSRNLRDFERVPGLEVRDWLT